MKKKLIMLMVICCIGLIGCGSANESSNDLEKQVVELKEENKTLKTENEKLKQSIDFANDLVGITEEENESDTPINNTTKSDDKVEYIRNFLSLESANVKICEGYSGKEAGIENISIKNNGNKSIEKLTVTVYFQDENGKDIAEDSFLVIGDRYENTGILKANYSWKMETNKYYAMKNLSDEIDITRNRVEISEIEFGE